MQSPSRRIRPTARPALQWATLLLALATHGCAGSGRLAGDAACPEAEAVVAAEQVKIFRRAETRRAAELTREIDRLQADLRKAESALIEAESGLAGSHTRADAVSSLAVARIQVERAATSAPWRAKEIEAARRKLAEAERQVSEGRFGAALFFVYRAQRVAESVNDEASQVIERGSARVIHGRRVNLRAGPSVREPVLSVLEAGTPVFPQSRRGEWMLVQVSGGPTGWVHRSLVGARLRGGGSAPASPWP